MDSNFIRRLSFWAIGATTAIFALALLTEYLYKRGEIIKVASFDARRDLDVASSLIYDRLSEAKTAVVNCPLLEDSADNKRIIENLLIHNSDIYGASIALDPVAAQKLFGKDRYMLYSHRLSDGSLRTFVLSDSLYAYYHYPEREWFAFPMAHGIAHWSDPYYDTLTSGELMVSFSSPLLDADSARIGVILADITLKDGINRIVSDVDSLSDHRTFMLSSDGQLVFGDTTDMSDDFMFYEPLHDTGWTIGHIIPRKALFRDLYSTMINLLVLFVLTVLIISITIYYTISWMARPAVKKQMRINAELSVASRIQDGMLPKAVQPFPDREDIDLASLMKPAKEVGGDFYNYSLDGDLLYFVIGDVSGKGVPAAIIMAIAMKMFKLSTHGITDPSVIVGKINDALTLDNKANMFVTLILGVLDLRSHRLSLCNAGHNHPVLIHSGSAKLLSLESNIPIGVIGGYQFSAQVFDFPIGSKLVMYTDGVTEAENSKHQQFGNSRLQQVIDDNINASPHHLCQAIYSAVHNFTAGFEQSDDITLLIIDSK